MRLTLIADNWEVAKDILVTKLHLILKTSSADLHCAFLCVHLVTFSTFKQLLSRLIYIVYLANVNLVLF